MGDLSARIFADLSLSRQIECAEALANVAFVETRALLDPSSGAGWMETGGAYALFDTPDSPVTQTFGLGMAGEVSASDLDAIEAFFRKRGAPVHHEISPLADASVWPHLAARRYQPIEFTNLLFAEPATIQPDGARADIEVRIARPAECDLWCSLASAGWSAEQPEMTAILKPIMTTTFQNPSVVPFLALKSGKPLATAALNIQGDVALLAGGSTIPEGRKQGAQSALLAARLRHAVTSGCHLAAMGAQPGSASQRNAERCGFRIAYTRTKWKLPSL